jgi:Rod binding domain-containing protein
MGTARSFEAVLLESLLDSLEKTFSAVPGSESGQASDTYHYLGTQALAGALAQAGGFGIARMIANNLLKTQGKTLED